MPMVSRDTKEDNPRIDDFTQFHEEERPIIEIAFQPEFYKVPRKFGNVPVEEEPRGYDKKRGYDLKFPKIDLPVQKIEEINFGNPEIEPKNRLFWGDNLHVMRTLPSESLDLIYIDPPFFSGQRYNVVFGDQNEIRSFSDIWDGGMPTYITWLNARILEMKRLLKRTGSLIVHCDYHASHYIKVELDKIFGYDNFVNEIIWRRANSHNDGNKLGVITDTLFFYSRTNQYTFHKVFSERSEEETKKEYPYIDEISGKRFKSVSMNAAGQGDPKVFGEKGLLEPPSGTHWRWNQDRINKALEEGKIFFTKNGVPRYKQFAEDIEGKQLQNLWSDFMAISSQSTERIGYPTQKPEQLLERILLMASNEGDVVADFFCGGGTTPAVATRLKRKWIACDISRIAVEVTKGRLLKQMKSEKGVQQTLSNLPNIALFSWGFYDISKLSYLSDEEFKDFIIKAYGARRAQDSVVCGTKDGFPIWVGPKEPNSYVTEDDVLNLAQYLSTYSDKKKKGIMVAWQFSEGAKKAQNMLAELGEGIDFITIDMVTIGSDGFRQHIVEKHADYSNFLRFILPPQVRLNIRKTENRSYQFDFSESISLNNGRIINIQADFDFDGTFSPTTGYYFTAKNGDQNQLLVTYEFPASGDIKVAFRIEDDQGGEALVTRNIEVK